MLYISVHMYCFLPPYLLQQCSCSRSSSCGSFTSVQTESISNNANEAKRRYPSELRFASCQWGKWRRIPRSVSKKPSRCSASYRLMSCDEENVASLPPCRFQSPEVNIRRCGLLQVHNVTFLTCRLALTSSFSDAM